MIVRANPDLQIKNEERKENLVTPRTKEVTIEYIEQRFSHTCAKTVKQSLLFGASDPINLF